MTPDEQLPDEPPEGTRPDGNETWREALGLIADESALAVCVGMRGTGKSTAVRFAAAWLAVNRPDSRAIFIDWLGVQQIAGGWSLVEVRALSDLLTLPHRAWLRFPDKTPTPEELALLFDQLRDTVLIVDESAFDAIKEKALPDWARVSRNRGVGGIVCAQRPTDFKPDVRGNARVALAFRLKMKRDAERLEEESNGTGWEEVLQLSRFEFLVHIEDEPGAVGTRANVNDDSNVATITGEEVL